MELAFTLIPILVYLFFLAITVFILYLVIQAAVRNGINTSIIGKQIKKQNELNPNKKD